MEELYRSEWAEWKQNRATRYLLKALSEWRKNKLEGLAHGHAQGLEEIYLEIGRAQGLEDALHFFAEDVKYSLIDDSEVEDVQSEGSGVSRPG